MSETTPNESTLPKVEWRPPGPGRWSFDASHQSRPYGRLMESLYVEPYAAGFTEAMQRSGSPLATIKIASVHGWMFNAPQPLGGKPGGEPPPRWLMRLLFKLHPELRRRRRRAAEYVAGAEFRASLHRWNELDGPQLEAELAHEQSIDVHALDDVGLVEAWARAAAFMRRLVHLHFAHAVDGGFPIGDYLVHAQRWAGVTAPEAMRALSGHSTATRAPVLALVEVCDALREAGHDVQWLDAARALSVPEQIERVRRVSAATQRSWDAYFERFRLAPVTGLTLLDETLEERPAVALMNLRAAFGIDGDPGHEARSKSDAYGAELLAAVPTEHRAVFETMMDDARRATHRREDDVGLLCRAGGLCRRVAKHAGERLVAAGRLDQSEQAFDLTAEELGARLRGEGPSLDQIRAHTATRRRNSELQPPATIGEGAGPPSLGHFPAEVARVVAGVMTFVSRFDRGVDPVASQPGAWGGHGISDGVVEARACVCRSPDDFEDFREGDVLVAPTTAPSYNVLLGAAAGVVTETGGIICHAAIVAREFSMPGVVGVAGVCDEVSTGDWVRVDGSRGLVTRIAAPSSVVSEPRGHRGGAEIDERADEMSTDPGVYADPRPLSESDAMAPGVTPELIGGKAASLCALAGAGERTPGGWVLGVDAARAVAKDAPGARAQLRAWAQRAGGPWAVRSSAPEEDGAGSSFAGQFLSRLGVVGPDALVEAVIEVVASANSEGVQAYRRRLQLGKNSSMAVIIQPMIDARVAGVMLPCTHGGRPGFVIESAWGLGETVVDGAGANDRFIVDAHGAVLEHQPGEQRMVRRSTARGVEHAPRARDHAHQRSLSADELRRLCEAAARIGKHFGEPRDVEWAFGANGLVILQARPVTRSLVFPGAQRASG